ncbi:hypothetical protein [Photobacterium leiognathi]|uniref:hypothetical protein n=1 Tax=Photobacterium leiognathi TaxID=553611 RepID=UPI00298188AF|nr:hypothetical protein [Photobacterium leiognathi]
MKELIARTQLVDPASGKHIKRIDERTITEYFQLLYENSSQNVLYVPDFSSLISSVNKDVGRLLENHSDKELRVMHSTVYNMWNKAKLSSVQTVKEKLNVEVLTKSEEILNTIHQRLPNYERGYTNPEPRYQGYQITERDIDLGLDKLLAEIRVFIEVVLCHIHSSVLLDPMLLREPSIYQHCKTLKSKLREWLLRESGIRLNFSNNTYWMDDDSLIYQLCVEDEFEFSAEIMLPYLELKDITCKSDIKYKVFSNVLSRKDGRYEVNYIEWPKADSYKLARAGKILELLRQVDSILKLFHAAKINDVEYDSSENIFSEIKEQLVHSQVT